MNLRHLLSSKCWQEWWQRKAMGGKRRKKDPAFKQCTDFLDDP